MVLCSLDQADAGLSSQPYMLFLRRAHVRIIQDRNIILWNPHTGTRVKTYVGHGYDVRDATVSSDNSKFASCGGDKQASITHDFMACPGPCGNIYPWA